MNGWGPGRKPPAAQVNNKETTPQPPNNNTETSTLSHFQLSIHDNLIKQVTELASPDYNYRQQPTAAKPRIALG